MKRSLFLDLKNYFPCIHFISYQEILIPNKNKRRMGKRNVLELSRARSHLSINPYIIN